MGLFKKQLLKVIEFEDDSKDVLVTKFQLKDREEIMNSSTLVVDLLKLLFSFIKVKFVMSLHQEHINYQQKTFHS